MRTVLVTVLLLLLTSSLSQGALPLQFDDPTQQKRYQSLLTEIRCLVCQNQSLADSNAELAQDLRREVHRLINSGASDDEVTEFLVARYGDFALYRPPLKSITYLLWFGPALLLLMGVATAVRLIKRQPKTPSPLSAAELQRAESLLAEPQRND